MPNQLAFSHAPPRVRRVTGLLVMLMIACGHGKVLASHDQVDLTAMPIEQLMTLEVFSASKFVQKVSEAPSTVSIVTAADIKAFGWRSLADILRSLRGLYVSNDRNYSYLGARGFLRPGDYNTRFLLLIDGNRMNDAVFDQASIGSEFSLDVDLIERVEFVPGPGSSIYGPNAFFGVVNVITKSGRELHGAQTSVEVGSHRARKVHASYGVRGEGGAELLLSVSAFRERGPDLYFGEFDTPASNFGLAQGLDYDRGQKLFIKGAAGPFSLSLMHSERKKGIPTASYDQVFNDPRSHTLDSQSTIDFAYRTTLSAYSEVVARLYWGSMDYEGDYIYDFPPVGINRDGADARWWGSEMRLTTLYNAKHKMVFGAEYQRDYRRDQYNFDVEPYAQRLNDHRDGHRLGVYLQEELSLRDDLLLNAGIRYDRSSSAEDTFNPRFALIHKASAATTLKILYGTAFRAPNAYELYYQMLGEGGQKANPDLRRERIRTYELSAEQYLEADTRVTASLFHNTVSNLITLTEDPADGLLVFRNLDKAIAHGAEFEYEKAWIGGTRMRASYSWQRARDARTGTWLVNSPRHLAKFNWSVPVFDSGWRAGIESQFLARRATLRGQTGSYWLTNLTMSSARLAPGLAVSASIYNLFDRRYADPGSEEHAQDALRQNGRTFRVKLSYMF